MLTLFHYPFCPHSRFVRLALDELSLEPRLVEERPWERRTEFLKLNPAGTVPVLLEEGMPPVAGAAIIVEYLNETLLDETRGGKLPRQRLRASRYGG
jgi:glutathione S-transferase